MYIRVQSRGQLFPQYACRSEMFQTIDLGGGSRRSGDPPWGREGRRSRDGVVLDGRIDPSSWLEDMGWCQRGG